mgnify:FL=1
MRETSEALIVLLLGLILSELSITGQSEMLDTFQIVVIYISIIYAIYLMFSSKINDIYK